MINYIVANNPDNRILEKCKLALLAGEVICFPTDTNWVIAAHPFEKKAVEFLYNFRGVNSKKHFAILCPSISHAADLAIINDQAYCFLKKRTPGHFTFILEAQKKVAKSIKASKSDKEVGLRFPPNKFNQIILQYFDFGLITTQVTKQNLSLTQDIPLYSLQIEEEIGHQLYTILDPGEWEFAGLSTVIDMTTPEYEIIRQGIG